MPAACGVWHPGYHAAMDSQRIKELVSALHKELDQLPQADEGLKQGLRTLAQDAERLVDEGASGGPADQITNEIREVTADFEARYPRLSLIVGDLVDALGKLGI